MSVRLSKAMEDEVNGSLGGLLGMLEVLVIDVEEPLSARQQRVVADALRFGDSVRASVEALLTLLSDDAEPRFAKSEYALRRLVDHAVRAAGWSAGERGVTLELPVSGDWEGELLWLDAARTDRALRAMTDALVLAAGPDGVVTLTLELAPASVALVLTARGANLNAPLGVPQLVRAAWQQLVEQQGGQLALDPAAPSVRLTLPKAAAGGVR